MPFAPVSSGPRQAGEADDRQAHRNRHLGIGVEHVDEDGHCQNRSASAKRPEDDADAGRQEVGEQAHASVTPLIN